MPMVAHAEAHSFLPYMGGKRRRGGTGEEAPGGAPWGRGEEAGGGTKTKGWGGRGFRMGTRENRPPQITFLAIPNFSANLYTVHNDTIAHILILQRFNILSKCRKRADDNEA